MDDSSPRIDVERTARRQHGVIRRADALAAGMTNAQIERRVRRGQWVAGSVRGILLLAETADEPLARLAAATQIPNSLAARESALALWGVVSMPARPVVIVDRRRNVRNVTTIACAQFCHLPATARHGISTLRLESAICSLATSPGNAYPRARLDSVIDEVLRRGLTTTDRLVTAIAEWNRHHRRGRRLLEAIRLERSRSNAVPLSDWSRRFAERLVASGLRRPELEWRVCRPGGELIAQVDLAYPHHRYAIELDSVAFHLDREAFEGDRRRDIQLAHAGWRVDRFTWDMCEHDWPFVAKAVAARLDAAADITIPDPLVGRQR